MKYGEAVRQVFDAHYNDMASDNKLSTKCTRYTHDNLRTAFELMPWKWKKQLLMEFSVITGELRRHILSCPHEKVIVPYNECEECSLCGAVRRMELEDQNPNSYNERKVWSEWRIY
jgi:hypothetical protein